MSLSREKYLPYLERTLQYFGCEIKPDGQMRCPNASAHNNGDKNFSAKLYKNESNGHPRVKCFVCGFDGDVYDVVGHFKNETEFTKQYQILEEIFGHATTTNTTAATTNEQPEALKEKKPDKPKLPPASVTLENAKEIYSLENMNRVRSFSKNELIATGKIVRTWNYTDLDGNIAGVDARIESDNFANHATDGNESGKKEKIVCTFWYNGKHLKMSDGPYIIYRLYESIKGDDKDKPVIIHEGAKCADLGNDALKSFCNISYNRGSQNADKHDWKRHYEGRKVYILNDNDTPGIAAAQKIKAKLPDAIILKNIYSHFEIDDIKGADIEQILEQATPEEIEEYILNYSERKERRDDLNKTPNCLGVSDGGMLFFIDRSMRLINTRRNKLQKGDLLTLMPLDYWQYKYGNDKGVICWDRAIDEVLEESFSREFDETKLRGRGAWREDDNFIYHDGKNTSGETSGEYMYIRKNKRDIGINSTPIEKEKMKWFKKLCEDVSFEKTSDMIRLLSWSLISPFCGALKFRPGLLLTGESGSGKTTILEKIVVPISNGMHLNAHYTSPAGIRAKTGIDSCAVLLEEAEANQNSNDLEKNQNRNALFSMMRASSSDNAPSGVKSNTDQQAVEYKMKNMFLFVSITPSIADIADDNRILKVNFDHKKSKSTGTDRRVWSEVEKDIVSFLSVENCKRMRAYIWTLLPKIIKDTELIIDVMKDQKDGFGKSSRDADAESILISTYINVFHDFDITRENVHKFLEKYYKTVGKEDERNETDELLNKIFDHVIEVQVGKERRKISVKEALDCLKNKTFEMFMPDLSYYEAGSSARDIAKNKAIEEAEKEIRRILGHNGLALQRDETLAISKSNDSIKKIINREDGYGKIFHRHRNFVIDKAVNINNRTQYSTTIAIYRDEKKLDPDVVDIPF